MWTCTCSKRMRRATLAALLLAACAAPSGAPIADCDASWLDVEPRIESGVDGERVTVPIDCFRQAGRSRIRVGFTMPAGPSCYEIGDVAVVEGADEVSVTLFLVRDDDPLAGACPEQEARAITEFDLQAPVDGRILLDGSRQE
jgi:hypothetical protein